MKRFLWLSIFLPVMIWSSLSPKDPFTWFLEVLPVFIGVILLVLTSKKFPLTPLLYILILIHMIILMVGGHYTYAEVPLFEWIKEIFDHTRNNYDKVGHFAQGFIPAILAREILIRKNIVQCTQIWLNFIILSIVLAFSAFYELVEWWVALIVGEDAVSFLGTQGYIWDTQSDMGYALFGASLALLFLSRLHDRQLNMMLDRE